MRPLSAERDALVASVERGQAVLVPGFHAVKHAARFGADLTHVFVLSGSAARLLAADLAPDVLAVIDRAETIDAAAMTALGGEVHPTGVLALARKPESSGPVVGPGVVLEDPRHLGNVGASIRVAAALGARSLATTGPADVWLPAALRGSAGLHWALTVEAGIDLGDLDGPLIGLDPGGRPIGEVALPPESLLVFGTERHGLSQRARALCDEVVRIPMTPGVSSLNLATSVAIALDHLVAGRVR